MSLYSSLKGNPELLKHYGIIITTQKELGLVEEVKNTAVKGEIHYLPHHSVVRDVKSTTKVKIVFDASPKQTGPSLIECFQKGSQITPSIFDILLRFHTFKTTFFADTEKDRDFLRFMCLVNNLK